VLLAWNGDACECIGGSMERRKDSGDIGGLLKSIDCSFEQLAAIPLVAERYAIQPVRMRLFRNDECVDVDLSVGRRKGTIKYPSLTPYWAIVRDIVQGDQHPGQKTRSVLELLSTVLINDVCYIRTARPSPARSAIVDGLRELLTASLVEKSRPQYVVLSEGFQDDQHKLLQQLGSDENRTVLADILFADFSHVRAVQEHERRGHFRELVPYRAKLSKVDVRWVEC
jgi:hypothetical protein